MKYHLAAFLGGIILDALIGDPVFMPHPVRWIGRLIYFLEKRLLKIDKVEKRDPKRERINGMILVFAVILITGICSVGILIAAYRINVFAGVITEAVMTAYTLAAKDLKVESMRVYGRLSDNDIKGAREAVGMIVGRETGSLSDEAVVRATVETIAENTTDGIIAPLIFDAFLTGAGGMIYKAVNTMDSMVGYKNERYLDFGRAAARLDDKFNFMPARITAFLMMAASIFHWKKYDGAGAVRVFFRDRNKTESLNAGQTESVMAGALGISLGGDAIYFGKKVHKAIMGDDIRNPLPEDIVNANGLSKTAYIFGIIICVIIIMSI